LREAVYWGKHWESEILAALWYGGVESFDAIASFNWTPFGLNLQDYYTVHAMFVLMLEIKGVKLF